MSKQKHSIVKASKKSISSMILSILMLLSVIPLHSSTIYADGTRKTIMNKTGSIEGYDKTTKKYDSVYFGFRNVNIESHKDKPIKWGASDTKTNMNEEGKIVRFELLDKFDENTDKSYLINSQLNRDERTNYSSNQIKNKMLKEQIQQKQYTLKILNDGNGKAKAILNGNGKVTEAQVSPITFVSLEATANPRYKFKQWEVLEGSPLRAFDAGNKDAGFEMPRKNVTIKAIFESIEKVTISFEGNGGTGNMESVELPKNTKYRLPDCSFTAPANKEFDAWEVKSARKNPDQEITVTENITVKALWKDKVTKHKITVEDGTKDKLTAAKGEKVRVTAIRKENKVFDKWTTRGIRLTAQEEKTSPLVFTMPDNDVVFTANFKDTPAQPQEYTVTIKSNNMTMGKVAPDKVEHVAKDTVIVENGNKLRINGKEVIATAENGYKFKNWTGIPPAKKIVDNVEITANFEQENQPPQPQEYTVTIKSNNMTMGKVAPDKVEHVAKDTVIVENGNKLRINGKEVIATAENGYKFKNWTGIPPAKKIVDNVEITANFEQKNQLLEKRDIRLTDDGNGTTEAVVGGVRVTKAEQGKKVTIIATPDRGYKFDEWRVLSGGIRLRDEDSATTTFTMPDNDVEIKAYFKKKNSGGNGRGSSSDTDSYNITTKTDKNGTVEVRSKAREGTEVLVTVSPNKGYKLDEITVTDKRGRDIKVKETNREDRYKFTMPARDVTVEATFKQIKQEQPSKPTTPPTIPPTNNNKPTENNIIKKQQTTVFTIGSNIMTVITDGKATQTTIDAKPFLSQGRVMIPVRYAAESLGMQVEWNKQTQTVVLKDRENTVMIPIKTNKIIVGNQEYTSDVTPILKNGRTYLTISNIAKALRMRAGQDVKWDNKIKQVTIIKEVEVR